MNPNQPPDPKAPRPLQIQLDDDVAQGTYSNLVMINHSETEFFLDFIFVPSGSPRAKVRSRMLLNPRQAKRLIGALQENVGKYEQRFGTIPATPLQMMGMPTEIQ